MSNELWKHSASDLATMIKKKQVSSVEVIESHLARIDAVNPRLNAITVTLAETALAAAKVADTCEASGPLHGVPFTIKENIDCAGSATTQGVPAMEGAIPAVDAVQVERMKAAGAIPLARTNLPEFGLRISTDNNLRGRTLNPWNIERVAGGSSGGEASSIASGMSPMGLGNDIGGSLRNPAYCCGITSLKPTTGRVAMSNTIPPVDLDLAGQLMHAEGPMARHVKDVRLGYEILSGRDPRDPVSVDVPLYGPEPQSRKVALVTNIPEVNMPDATIAAVLHAGEIMRDAGWEVEEASPPELAQVTQLWGQLLSMDVQTTLPLIEPLLSSGSASMLYEFLDKFKPDTLVLSEVHAQRYRLTRLWSEFFQSYPLVIGPTWTDIPFRHDEDIQPGTGAEITINRLRFITPGNALGIPAASVPTGIDNGLPTGVQVYADLWRDDLCLLGAELIEKAVGQICPIDPVWE